MSHSRINKLKESGPEAHPVAMETRGKWGESLSTVAFLSKSLSDENRLRVLISLREGRLSVSSLVEALQLSQPLISHHLKELKRSLLVKVERNGPFIYYQLADKRILQIIEDLETVARELLANRRTF
jgi:ArsR family transcriptional regulator, zinc-responsive transcriptional repressor